MNCPIELCVHCWTLDLNLFFEFDLSQFAINGTTTTSKCCCSRVIRNRNRDTPIREPVLFFPPSFLVKKEIPGRFGWTCAATESTDVGLHLMSSSVRERLQLLSSSSELTAVPAARSLLLIATTGFRRCRVVSASTVPDSTRLVFQLCLFLLSDLVFVLSCSRETIFPRWTSK